MSKILRLRYEQAQFHIASIDTVNGGAAPDVCSSIGFARVDTTNTEAIMASMFGCAYQVTNTVVEMLFVLDHRLRDHAKRRRSLKKACEESACDRLLLLSMLHTVALEFSTSVRQLQT